jgi:Na+-transporting methylmalonyl-CoA/oxaloacetate decarboxylase gamma subunit
MKNIIKLIVLIVLILLILLVTLPFKLIACLWDWEKITKKENNHKEDYISAIMELILTILSED